MTKEQLAVLNAALAWKACDDAEPIPSPEPGKKLLLLAYAVDALRKSQAASPKPEEGVPPATALFWETSGGWLTSGHPSLPSRMVRCPRRAFYRLEHVLPESTWEEAYAAADIALDEKATDETPAAP